MSKKPFNGVIKLDVRDSKADWTPYELKRYPGIAEDYRRMHHVLES